MTTYGHITIDKDGEPSSTEKIQKILDVYYLHVKCNGNGDLYVTQFGLPIIETLRPYNYLTDRKWYNSNSVRLSGYSFRSMLMISPTLFFSLFIHPSLTRNCTGRKDSLLNIQHLL